MIRRPPRSTPLYSSAASDVYKRQAYNSGFHDRLHKYLRGRIRSFQNVHLDCVSQASKTCIPHCIRHCTSLFHSCYMRSVLHCQVLHCQRRFQRGSRRTLIHQHCNTLVHKLCRMWLLLKSPAPVLVNK
eukprot:TRINITY_DN4963_c0_g1_i1.p2 TRINITY_DN4963_c0_g1~~TRINITY_DN4963_c0_g1_i1.p2  ORF type:complete len:137 (+),score=1.32 TRINITY_DN4963_c0_g1_i1:25-411(+)